MKLGHLSLVFVQEILQLFKAHSKACGLLKLYKNTAGNEGAKWGTLTKGMPPHLGQNPSTSKKKSWGRGSNEKKTSIRHQKVSYSR